MTVFQFTTLVLLAAAAAGCMEKPQADAKPRKSDVAAFQGSGGSHTVGEWKAGDATGWEAQMKKRAQYGQNEYSRSTP
jgi:hypothetical protein